MNPNRLFAFLLGLLAAFVPCLTVAQDDEITVDGIAVPGIEIIGLREGQLVYLDFNGGERLAALGRVSDLRIDAHPAYAQAVSLLAQDRPQEAAAMFRDVLRAAGRNEPWLRQLAGWRLVQALDAQDAGLDAVAAFSVLVGTEPDPALLSNPPLASAGNLRGDEADRAVAQLERAMRRASDPARAAIQALLDVLTAEDPPLLPNPQPSSDANPAPAAADLPASGDATLVLPRTLQNSDAATVQMLRAGEYEEARVLLASLLRNEPRRLQQRHYLMALAQLKIAEQTGQRDDYLDAGLGFMRVVSMSRSGSAFLGPALLEAGVVHRRLGLDEHADALFEEAGLLLDAQDEPDYFRRMLEVTAGP